MRRAVRITAVLLTFVLTSHAAACTVRGHAASKCAGCTVSLKASAFGDTNPKANGVGTTAGHAVNFKITLHGGCHLPAGAHFEFGVQRLDENGNRVGKPRFFVPSSTSKCTLAHCTFTYNPGRGGFIFQAVLTGCHKTSNLVRVVWVGKGSGGSGTGSGGGSGGTARWTLTNVAVPSGYSSFCTVTNPTLGQPDGHVDYVTNNSHGTMDFELPIIVETGATASFKTFFHTESGAEDSNGFGVGLPTEFGVSPNNFRVDAHAPAHGDATANEPRTFTVATPPTAGATVTVIIDICSNYIYFTYTAK